jgi:AcrR family transcriptional regulator
MPSKTGRPTAAQRQTQAERRSESDRRLISAAIRLIARQGASGTSLADIGLAAGYSRGLPAERFGSKQVLLLALIDEFDSWFQSRLARVLAGKTGLAALEARMGAHIDGFVEYPEGAAAQYHLVLESLGLMPELHERVCELEATYRNGFIAHMKEAKAMGEIQQDIDDEQYAVMIQGTIRGIHMQSLLRRDTDVTWAKRATVDVYVNPLRARASRAAPAKATTANRRAAI